MKRITERTDVDCFIIGFLILFLFVYVSELLILVPCGSFASLATCDLPQASKDFWTSYFALDPLFARMEPYYATIMSIQDYLYNPWWAICLFMFWTDRQDAPWLRTITILVTGMIVATSLVILGAQLQHPHYTARVMLALLLINGPWIAGPLLFAWRFRHGSATATAPRRGSLPRALLWIALPFAGYVVFCTIATAIT